MDRINASMDEFIFETPIKESSSVEKSKNTS